MQLRGADHVVLVSPDPERLEEWRRGDVPFVSLRVSPDFLIDIVRGDRTGMNVDHLALVVDGVDLDELATSGRFDVEMGPADLFGARGTGRGLYVRDPDGNKVELRTY